MAEEANTSIGASGEAIAFAPPVEMEKPVSGGTSNANSGYRYAAVEPFPSYRFPPQIRLRLPSLWIQR
jgi:hypothetical protein